MLEKKETVLLKKAESEVEKAKEFTRAKNKRGTWQCSCYKEYYCGIQYISSFRNLIITGVGSWVNDILYLNFFLLQRQYNVWRRRGYMSSK